MKIKCMLVSVVILTISTIGQIILAIFLYNPLRAAWQINTGWLVLWISAFFGWVPIYTFRKKGNVEGRSYIYTTTLVSSGVYTIVRHPQYLAVILMSVALPLITLHWSIVLLGISIAVVTYKITFEEEKGCIEKFGDEYLEYMEDVPRINFILGIGRLIRKRIRQREGER